MMRPLRWGMMPADWIITQRRLPEFTVRDISRAVPALKAYLALLAFVRGLPSGDLKRGQARLSYDQLASAAGLARGHVSAALASLSGLVHVYPGRGRQANVYEIANFPERGANGWRRVPTGYVINRRVLPDLSARRRTDLAALKCYLLFLAMRDGATSDASVTHNGIREYTGISKRDVRPAISVLANLELIRVNTGRTAGSFGHNVYHIRGLDAPVDAGGALLPTTDV